MADNPNATSANANTRSNANAPSASPNATTATSGSLIGHGESQQQRCRNDNQQPLHASLLWGITANSTQKRNDDFVPHALTYIKQTICPPLFVRL
jgi:hypothetical protein